MIKTYLPQALGKKQTREVRETTVEKKKHEEIWLERRNEMRKYNTQ